MLPSKEKVEEIIKELQKIMRIRDWKIEVFLLNNAEFNQKFNVNPEKPEFGRVKIYRRIQEADVGINTETTDDWYKTLVHEMFHIATEKLDYVSTMIYNLTNGNIKRTIDDSLENAIEMATERMAEIFIKVCPYTSFIEEEIKVGGTE